MSGANPGKSKGEFWRLFAYVKPFAWVFVCAVLLTAVVGMLEAVVTALVVPLVDALKSGGAAAVEPVGQFDLSGRLRGFFPEGQAYWPTLAAALVGITLF